jgi:hypothetical protein
VGTPKDDEAKLRQSRDIPELEGILVRFIQDTMAENTFQMRCLAEYTLTEHINKAVLRHAEDVWSFHSIDWSKNVDLPLDWLGYNYDQVGTVVKRLSSMDDRGEDVGFVVGLRGASSVRALLACLLEGAGSHSTS